MYNAKKSDWLVSGNYVYCVSIRLDLLIQSLAAAIIVQIVYLLTVNPTIVGGDNGEVMTSAIQLGTAHPPGISC